MAFDISARTILQLGRELISSDSIAFYELIKNAFDAQEDDVNRGETKKSQRPDSATKKVWVRVTVRVPLESANEARERLGELKSWKAADIRAIAIQLAEATDIRAPGGQDFYDRLLAARSKKQLSDILDETAVIEFEDCGHGMSMRDLREVYLRIGTPSRILQQESDSDRVYLGEKGIGRLSVMRLGSRLFVETAKRGETHWNTLTIDWRDFEKDLNNLVQDVSVEPELGSERDDADRSRTLIRITAIRAAWTEDKLREIATKELSRFMDPFSTTAHHQVFLKFNERAVGIPQINTLLFEKAHAKVEAELTYCKHKGPQLLVHIDFRQHERSESIRVEGADLRSMADVSSDRMLTMLGPFSVVFYWFNRQALKAIEGFGTKRKVQELVNAWSGGLMVYRDGFRIPPYGTPDDDWLGIDKIALGSGGYKVNRSQLVGKVIISKRENPTLVDQTNREGLQDNPQKQILQILLFKLLTKVFKSFIEKVADEVALQNAPTIGEISGSFDRQRRQLRENVRALRRVANENPTVGLDSLARDFSRVGTQIQKTLLVARRAQENIDRRRERLVDLAGLGLLADIIAHELNRSLIHALKGIKGAVAKASDRTLLAQLGSAQAQLNTLQKRVAVLDRLATSGRQRKSKVDVNAVVESVVEARSEQFRRHGIAVDVSSSPSNLRIRIQFVTGMLYQILENFTENSVYWLKEQKQVSYSFAPRISIRVDFRSASLYFYDNGPGIAPENAERVFAPFFSLKRGQKGKGLGLYISRELAEDQKAGLSLSLDSDREDGRLNTFVLDFSEILVDEG